MILKQIEHFTIDWWGGKNNIKSFGYVTFVRIEAQYKTIKMFNNYYDIYIRTKDLNYMLQEIKR